MSTYQKVASILIAGSGVAVIALASTPSEAQPAQKLDVESVRLAQDTALRVRGEKTFFFRGEFMIDADGAPKAYHPGFTCGGATNKGWRRATGIDCAARPPNDCRVRGFKDDPAPGAYGEMVRCGTKKIAGKWQCTQLSLVREKQGDCTQDATANSGLDYLANAGEPGNFYGIVTDKKGVPVLQGPNDPAPGYYISATALGNPAYPSTNPLRFVDSTAINYIALPPSAMKSLGAKKGDYVVAIHWNTGKTAGAIFADVGSDRDDDLGEGSIALAKELGIKGTPKGGGQREDVVYVVFTGSTDGFPKDQNTVATKAMAEFAKWGGQAKLMRAVPKDWADDYGKP
jgi:hypothetical protein